MTAKEKQRIRIGGEVILFLSAAIFQLLVKQVSGSGVFELQLLAFVNDAGIDSTGNCCGSGTNAGVVRGGPPCAVSSFLTCRTYFQVCLSHYQSSIPSEVACTFGKVNTSVLGGNSIYLGNNKNNTTTPSLSIPFDFTWPGSFSLIVEAWHNSTTVSSSSSWGVPDSLIFRAAIQGTLEAGTTWHLYDNASSDLHQLTFRFRVTCSETYFGLGCSDTCQPRDDKFGHYTCSREGLKICGSGWTGQYCDKAVCLDGCDPEHGLCEDPNECKCRLGWQGTLCRQCIPYPGCQRGSCDQPWQCNCEDGWGGLFCNQDLNFCTNHRPCMNSGTCTNAGQGSYTCTCPAGFTGANCEVKIEDCVHVPCQNGGTCELESITGQYRCLCPSTSHGSYCQWSLTKSCDLGPCLNNGTCRDRNGQYYCSCPAGYTGLNCETQLDACFSRPCINGGRCIAIPTSVSGFLCVCRNEYSGRFCQDDRNHCAGRPCLNGGACVPDVNEGFVCRCVAGYVGVLCQDNVDECLNLPCVNGATCVDLVNDFRCACAPGFTGRYCSDNNNNNVTSCSSAPCGRGATCVNTASGVDCLCPPGYHGNRCQATGVTLPLLVATPDKQVVGDVTSAINVQQIVLIVVLGVALPVIVILVGVVIVVVRRRRRRRRDDDVVNADVSSNVRRYGYDDDDDVNNRVKNKMADEAAASTSGGSGRPLKITNKERQQQQQQQRQQLRQCETQDNRRSNVFTVGQGEYHGDHDDVKRFTKGHVMTTTSRDTVGLSDCTCGFHRTCPYHGSTMVVEQQSVVEPPSKEQLSTFRVRLNDPNSTVDNTHRVASSRGRPTTTSPPAPHLSVAPLSTHGHRPAQGYVLATEV